MNFRCLHFSATYNIVYKKTKTNATLSMSIKYILRSFQPFTIKQQTYKWNIWGMEYMACSQVKVWSYTIQTMVRASKSCLIGIIKIDKYSLMYQILNFSSNIWQSILNAWNANNLKKTFLIRELWYLKRIYRKA